MAPRAGRAASSCGSVRASRNGAPKDGRKGDSSARRAGPRDQGVFRSALSSSRLETCTGQPASALGLNVKAGRGKDVSCSHQTTGEAAFVTCAVQDDVLDHPKGFRVFVQEQVLRVRQARQVTQPGITDVRA